MRDSLSINFISKMDDGGTFVFVLMYLSDVLESKMDTTFQVTNPRACIHSKRKQRHCKEHSWIMYYRFCSMCNFPRWFGCVISMNNIVRSWWAIIPKKRKFYDRASRRSGHELAYSPGTLSLRHHNSFGDWVPLDEGVRSSYDLQTVLSL